MDLDRNLWVSAGKKQYEKLVLNIKKLQKNYFLIIGERTSTCEVNFESLNCIRSKLAHHTRERECEWDNWKLMTMRGWMP